MAKMRHEFPMVGDPDVYLAAGNAVLALVAERVLAGRFHWENPPAEWRLCDVDGRTDYRRPGEPYACTGSVDIGPDIRIMCNNPCHIVTPEQMRSGPVSITVGGEVVHPEGYTATVVYNDGKMVGVVGADALRPEGYVGTVIYYDGEIVGVDPVRVIHD